MAKLLIFPPDKFPPANHELDLARPSPTMPRMTAILVKPCLMHPELDATLDMEKHRVLDRPTFYGRHKLYMNLSTTQGAAGLLHTLLLLWSWRRADVRMNAGTK